MKVEQLEKLIQAIRESNNSPVQKMSCLTCGFCEIHKPGLKGYCRYHAITIHGGFGGVRESVCFNYRPLEEKQC